MNKITTWMLLIVFACFIDGQVMAEETPTLPKFERKPNSEETKPAAVPATEAIKSETNTDANYILCKNGKAVRTIRIEMKGHSCRALYTKEGVDQMVGKSNATDVCQKVANRIKTNLEAGDWKCKDVSQARVSSSME